MLFHGGNDPELYIHRLTLVILRGFHSGSSRVLLRFCMGATFCLRNDFDYVPIVSNNFLGGEDWTQFVSIEFQSLNFGG